MGRVMHEFKHSELKSGRGGKAGKVESGRQPIASPEARMRALSVGLNVVSVGSFTGFDEVDLETQDRSFP